MKFINRIIIKKRHQFYNESDKNIFKFVKKNYTRNDYWKNRKFFYPSTESFSDDDGDCVRYKSSQSSSIKKSVKNNDINLCRIKQEIGEEKLKKYTFCNLNKSQNNSKELPTASMKIYGNMKGMENIHEGTGQITLINNNYIVNNNSNKIGNIVSNNKILSNCDYDCECDEECKYHDGIDSLYRYFGNLNMTYDRNDRQKPHCKFSKKTITNSCKDKK